MRIRRPWYAVATALGVVCACEGTPSGPSLEPVRDFTAQEIAVSSASTSFGLNLFREVSSSAAEDNVLLSPLSVSMALGMATNGAEGDTWTAMRTTLGFGSMDEAAMNEAYRGLIAQLRARDADVEFTLANSVWYEQTFSVEQPFLDAARTYFDAEVRSLDFRAPAAPGVISGWAESRTGGRIKDLIRTIDPMEVMFLVNAVYFKAGWSSPFEERATRDGPFRARDGTTVQVPMMSADASRPIYRDEDVDVVELLYEDSAFSMVVVVPAEGRTLEQTVQSLTPGRWDAWMRGLSPTRILLTMPRFRFDFGAKLNDALESLGMGIAFRSDEADFDRITRVRVDLYISRVEHKTFIAVDEEGTEAAAATAVGIAVTSLPPSITLDRPFLFAIRERSSGTLLFIGRVGRP